MTKWNMIKKQTTSNGKVISTGEKTTPLFDDTNTKELDDYLDGDLDLILFPIFVIKR